MSLVRLRNVGKRYGEKRIFHEIDFRVDEGERVGLIGKNGCGKTTLLNLILSVSQTDGVSQVGEASKGWDTAPARRELPSEGVIELAPGLRVGYFSQFSELDGELSVEQELDALYAELHALEERLLELDLDDTVSHAVNIVGLAYAAQRRKAHHFLELSRFSEMDLYQRIGTLSGGQRARVALAQCLLSGAGAILLDEPTNHLDLTTIQVMESALVHFPGAVIVATHDRFFVDKVANRLVVFGADGAAPGEVRDVSGNWSIYAASVQARVPG